MLAGALLERRDGWDLLFWMWILIAVIALLFSVAASPLWKRFMQSDDADA